MSDELDLAKQSGVTLESLAKAPIWLAAGILGVPALIAIAAGYFIAKNVANDLKQLNTYNLSELYQLNEQGSMSKHNFNIILKFIDDDLRVQYTTCLHSSHDEQERAACINPTTREREYGFPERRPSNGPPSP